MPGERLHGTGARFATHDLATTIPAVTEALGPGYIRRAAADRLTLTCAGCQGRPIVDLQLGRQIDGTEQRVRSGATTVAELERLCRAREPRGRPGVPDVTPAVGWLNAYPLGQDTGGTAIVVRDGDLLTIRAITQRRDRTPSDRHVAADRAGVHRRALIATGRSCTRLRVPRAG